MPRPLNEMCHRGRRMRRPHEDLGRLCRYNPPMNINLLVINIGNSRLAVGAFEKGELALTRRAALEDATAVESAIAEGWAKLAEQADAEVCVASVNAERDEAVARVIQQATGKIPSFVGRDVDLPMKVRTEKPEQTGVDRVLNVAAAYEQMQAACVVVDAGTAITIDVCNDVGEFLGGAIAPGAQLMLDSLHEHTSKLPEVKLAKPAGPVGQSTEQAMLQGVYHGLRGMVKELVEQYAEKFGNWPEIICTGGDAQLLFGGWELIHAISPDLTLYGIALAYVDHHITHGS